MQGKFMSELRFRYQTIDFENTDIHVRTLKDDQQFSDPHGIASELGISSANWPLFGIIWTSGEILAQLMINYDIEGKKVLEVGCGIALASLVLNSREADITATDYHPETQNFLNENTKLNHDKDIPFVRMNWSDDISNLGKFNVIIGSDILYERGHADLLANFIDRHATQNCKIIIIDPGRSHHGRFTRNMVSLGYTHSQTKPEKAEYSTKSKKGSNQFQVLHYQK
jgi:ETFB lysine methyltransferase